MTWVFYWSIGFNVNWKHDTSRGNISLRHFIEQVMCVSYCHIRFALRSSSWLFERGRIESIWNLHSKSDGWKLVPPINLLKLAPSRLSRADCGM